MEGGSRAYMEKRIRAMIRELEEQMNGLELKVDDADWESDIDYRKPIDALRLSLEEAKKAAEETAVSSDASWQIRFRETEDKLGELGDRIKHLRGRLSDFLPE